MSILAKKILDQLNFDQYYEYAHAIVLESTSLLWRNLNLDIQHAVYQDSDFVIVKKLILELWREHIHNIDQNLIDPKSFLQEWTLKKYKIIPEYKTLSKVGPDHEPILEI